MAPLNAARKVSKSIFVFSLLVSFISIPTSVSLAEMMAAEAVFNSAQSLWKQKKWEDAVTAYETYLADNPDGKFAAQAYMNLGQYLEGYGRLNEALDYYRQGLEKSEGRTAEIMQTEIASVQGKMGNLDEAITIYKDIMKQTPSWDLYKAANRNLKATVKLKASQTVYGSKSNDCGVESLKVVLEHIGITPKEGALKADLKNQGKEVSIDRLKQAALNQGLKSYGINSKDKNIVCITPPAILHFHPGHYVVLEDITPKGAKIFDPIGSVKQQRIVSLPQLKNRWTGYALIFDHKLKNNSSTSLLTKDEMKNIHGGHNWWHSGFFSWLGGVLDNWMTFFFDPPNILVNTASMNLVVEQIDGVWKGMTQNITLKRSYNADDSETGMFGNSWHFQYEVFLEENPDKSVTLTRGSGKKDIFISRGDGTYTPPRTVFDQLMKNVDDSFTLLIKRTKETYEFNPAGLLISIYDRNGNLIDINWSGNTVISIVIHYGPMLTKEITFSYGSSGFCEIVDLPDGRFVSFEYDTEGNLMNSTDPAGYETIYGYDSNNYMNVITDSSGTAEIIYQAAPWNSNIYIPQLIIDAENNQWNFSTDFSTIVNGTLTITDPNGHPTQYVSDQTTLFTTAIIDANGAKTAFAYDSYGNRTSMTDPNGQTWVMSYDPEASRGNLTMLTDPIGNSLTLDYDASDNLTSIDAPLDRFAEFEYDANNNPIKVIDSLLQEINLIYNSEGLLTKIVLPGNPIEPQIIFSYDPYGNLLTEMDPEGYTTTFEYNDAGNVTSRIDANGNTVSFTYDALDRFTQITYPDGLLTYEYDCCSLKRAVAKDGREMTFQYDANIRLTRYQDLNGFVLLYGYDDVGNLTSLTYPGGGKVVNYEYDYVDRLIAVRDWLGNRTEYGYDLSGNVTNMSYPNGTSAKLSYDKNHRLVAHENVGVTNQPLPRFAYLLDALGNRIGETRKDMGFYELPTQNISSAYDLADRILASCSTTFNHDENGRLIEKTMVSGITNYTYDYNNMLHQVQTPFDNYQYEYNPLFSRISRQVGAEETLFVVDPNRLLPEALMQTDAGQTPTDYNIYGLGLISRVDAAGNAYYYHFDGLGSTVAITDSSGNVVNRYGYGPSGELLNEQEAFVNPFRYVGRFGVMDEGNGLLYMRARYYDSETGRFLNKDPISLWGGFNLYAYVQNDPINAVDATGLVASPRSEDNNSGASFYAISRPLTPKELEEYIRKKREFPFSQPDLYIDEEAELPKPDDLSGDPIDLPPFPPPGAGIPGTGIPSSPILY